MKEKITFIGAGPVGCLAAIHFQRAGFEVEIFERRPDIRKSSIAAGRSINLALSLRGIRALNEVGSKIDVLKNAVPMFSRAMHDLKGSVTLSPYGIDQSFFINSISRSELNRELLSLAEEEQIKIHFAHSAIDYDFDSSKLKIETHDGEKLFFQAKHVVCTDGSSSHLRGNLMHKANGYQSLAPLGYAYKELTVASGENSSFRLDKNSLHIWPRGNFMLIALPNKDGSFTCTLFLAEEGSKDSFAFLDSPAKVNAFFETYFPDVMPLIENLAESFFSNPTGKLATVRCNPWYFNDQMLLLGDSAHGIVPFFGQGLNAGFEDCYLLNKMLQENSLKKSLKKSTDLKSLFQSFCDSRKVSTDAIANLALDNFIEMRDKVGQKRFLFEKEVERELMRRYPNDYFSRYYLVTFSHVPYEIAWQVGKKQDELLQEISEEHCDLSKLDFVKIYNQLKDKLESHNQVIRTFIQEN